MRLIAATLALAMTGAAPYQLTNNSLPADGQIVLRQSDHAFIPPDPRNGDFAAYQAWVSAGNVPDPAPSLPPTTIVTRAAFLALFTSAEMLAIASAAQTTPAINVWLITAQAHDVINLNDALTKAGLDAMVAAGILSAPRETAILANQSP